MHQTIRRSFIVLGLVSVLLISAQAEAIITKDFNARQRKHGENFSRAKTESSQMSIEVYNSKMRILKIILEKVLMKEKMYG